MAELGDCIVCMGAPLDRADIEELCRQGVGYAKVSRVAGVGKSAIRDHWIRCTQRGHIRMAPETRREAKERRKAAGAGWEAAGNTVPVSSVASLLAELPEVGAEEGRAPETEQQQRRKGKGGRVGRGAKGGGLSTPHPAASTDPSVAAGELAASLGELDRPGSGARVRAEILERAMVRLLSRGRAPRDVARLLSAQAPTLTEADVQRVYEAFLADLAPLEDIEVYRARLLSEAEDIFDHYRSQVGTERIAGLLQRNLSLRASLSGAQGSTVRHTGRVSHEVVMGAQARILPGIRAIVERAHPELWAECQAYLSGVWAEMSGGEEPAALLAASAGGGDVVDGEVVDGPTDGGNEAAG